MRYQTLASVMTVLVIACESGSGPNTETIVVPAGWFFQGCNQSNDSRCGTDEKPSRDVFVDAFRIDKNEVTVEDYAKCVNTGGCSEPFVDSESCNWNRVDRVKHPVNCINWYQAAEYCRWSNKRLCSESEWEKAARGTDRRLYPWGDDDADCEHAVLMAKEGSGCGHGSTWEVGSKPLGASRYDALDMSGNVYEWVEDDYHGSYQYAPTDGTAWVDTPRGEARSIRGGSYLYVAMFARSSSRMLSLPGMHDPMYGVRCCDAP